MLYNIFHDNSFDKLDFFTLNKDEYKNMINAKRKYEYKWKYKMFQ